MAQVVECLQGKLKALSSNPATIKKIEYVGIFQHTFF
jgi:hypothetical protein